MAYQLPLFLVDNPVLQSKKMSTDVTEPAGARERTQAVRASLHLLRGLLRVVGRYVEDGQSYNDSQIAAMIRA
jgi:hypothetical protein